MPLPHDICYAAFVASEVHPAPPGGTTHPLLEPSLYIPELLAGGREQALTELVDRLRSRSVVRDTSLLRLLLHREALGSTAIGKGVAIPHARSMALSTAHLVFARSPRGVDWEAPDGEAVHLVFLLLAPDTPPWHKHYLDLLAQLAALLRLARNRNRLLQAGSFQRVAEVLHDLA